MKKELCFKCESEDIEEFEKETIVIFRCNFCHNKWGRHRVKES